MRMLSGSRPSHRKQPSSNWSRVGMAGAAFFLFKGILWLLAPVLFAVMH
ncbi:MAG TPA: hypothetical protein VLS44_11965 [Nitrospira sp.]|nr:hypothetical protein [Nitrospira sp.]